MPYTRNTQNPPLPPLRLTLTTCPHVPRTFFATRRSCKDCRIVLSLLDIEIQSTAHCCDNVSSDKMVATILAPYVGHELDMRVQGRKDDRG